MLAAVAFALVSCNKEPETPNIDPNQKQEEVAKQENETPETPAETPTENEEGTGEKPAEDPEEEGGENTKEEEVTVPVFDGTYTGYIEGDEDAILYEVFKEDYVITISENNSKMTLSGYTTVFDEAMEYVNYNELTFDISIDKDGNITAPNKVVLPAEIGMIMGGEKMFGTQYQITFGLTGTVLEEKGDEEFMISLTFNAEKIEPNTDYIVGYNLYFNGNKGE